MRQRAREDLVKFLAAGNSAADALRPPRTGKMMDAQGSRIQADLAIDVTFRGEHMFRENFQVGHVLESTSKDVGQH